eukprot:1158646-Pelagomonas_calceolata.AAC.5
MQAGWELPETQLARAAQICLAIGPAYSELAVFSGARTRSYMAGMTFSGKGLVEPEAGVP